MKHLKSNAAFYIPLVIIVVIIIFIVVASFQNSTSSNSGSKPLMGQDVSVLSREHVPVKTKTIYNSNPPAAGEHYSVPQDAGIYITPPADGRLVHSLEHGAIILWYNPNKLSKDQVIQVQTIFKNMPQQKKIMTPRMSLAVPVALSSWGKIVKMQTIDEKQIKAFFETNYDRAPEQAPI